MRYLLLPVAISAVCSFQTPSFGQTASASVIIRAVDGSGKPVAFRLESFRAVKRPDVELALRFRGSTIAGLTLGESYTYAIEATNQKWKETGTVTVNNLRTVEVISMTPLPSVTFVGVPVARFVVVPSPFVDDELTWVAVRPALSSVSDALYRLETTVIDRGGRFELQGVHLGLYLMTFYRGSLVLGTKVVEVPFLGTLKQEVQIRLQ